MDREYLSSALTAPLKFLSGLMLVSITPIGVIEVFEGRPIFAIAIVLSVLFAVYSWIHRIVYIEGQDMVVQRFVGSVRLKPEDVRDVQYFGPTNLLKLSFTRKTELGRWVVFAARTKSVHVSGGPIEDEGPVFQRIGEFCGWKSK